jgi:hypothetical protein
MSIEKVPVFKDFPAEPQQSQLVLWIKRSIYRIFSRRVNWLLDRIKDDTIEIVQADQEIATDGNWRLFISGNDLLIQRLESGTWTTKSTISA